MCEPVFLSHQRFTYWAILLRTFPTIPFDFGAAGNRLQAFAFPPLLEVPVVSGNKVPNSYMAAGCRWSHL